MKRISIAVLCLGLVACNRTEADIQQAVRETLIDPGSAVFGQTTIARDGNSACVTVNSRNRLGGYAGEQEARVERAADGRWRVAAIPDEGCAANLMSLQGADDILEHVNRTMEEVEARSKALNETR